MGEKRKRIGKEMVERMASKNVDGLSILTLNFPRRMADTEVHRKALFIHFKCVVCLFNRVNVELQICTNTKYYG